MAGGVTTKIRSSATQTKRTACTLPCTSSSVAAHPCPGPSALISLLSRAWRNVARSRPVSSRTPKSRRSRSPTRRRTSAHSSDGAMASFYMTSILLDCAPCDGRLPDREGALRELPGVGRYAAGASLWFAYGRVTAVLDTNVRRVLGRVFMGPRRLADVRGQREFWDLAAALVPGGRGYDFN